jgi:hypothetical protein
MFLDFLWMLVLFITIGGISIKLQRQLRQLTVRLYEIRTAIHDLHTAIRNLEEQVMLRQVRADNVQSNETNKSDELFEPDGPDEDLHFCMHASIDARDLHLLKSDPNFWEHDRYILKQYHRLLHNPSIQLNNPGLHMHDLFLLDNYLCRRINIRQETLVRDRGC